MTATPEPVDETPRRCDYIDDERGRCSVFGPHVTGFHEFAYPVGA